MADHIPLESWAEVCEKKEQKKDPEGLDRCLSPKEDLRGDPPQQQENTIGDPIRVNRVTDYYDTVMIKNPHGDRHELKLYRAQNGEIQAICSFRGHTFVKSSRENQGDAIARLLYRISRIFGESWELAWE